LFQAEYLQLTQLFAVRKQRAICIVKMFLQINVLLEVCKLQVLVLKLRSARQGIVMIRVKEIA
jgi:hypothetical protein